MQNRRMTIGSREDLEYFVNYVGGKPAEESDDFLTTIQILIGEAVGDGADSFDLVVCTPNRLAEYFSSEKWSPDKDGDPDEDGGLDVLPGGNVLPVRGLWLMRHWSRTDFRAAVERLLRSCLPAPDWETFAYRVGLYIPWEFDYVHEREQNHRAGLPDIRLSFFDADWQPGD